MSRTKKFLGGVFFGYVQQILVTMTGLWLTPFLLRHIGQRDYGLWLVGLQILTWLTLMDLGIVGLLPRETAYSVGKAGSPEKAKDLPLLIAQTARIVLWQWPFVGLLGLLLLVLGPTSRNIQGPILIVAASFIIAFPMRIFRAVLEGLQDLHFLGRLQILAWSTGVLFSVSLVTVGFGLYALATGWAVTQLFVAVACVIRLKIKFPYTLPHRLTKPLDRAVFHHLGRGLWISLQQLAQALLDGSDVLIIGRALGSASVVPYSCTEKIVGVLSNQPAMIMHVASPGLSEIRSAGDRRQTIRVAINLTQAMLMLTGLVICVVLAANRSFVSWWVGSRQFAGSPLTILLTVALLLRHWNTSTAYSIFCFGLERRLSITTLVDGIVSVTASVLLVRNFGFIGAPLGSILGVCLVSLPMNLFALASESRHSPLAVVLPLWPWFWRFLLLACGSASLSVAWNPANAAGIVLTVSFVCVVYAVVMIPALLESSLRNYLPKKLTEAWNRLLGVQLSSAIPTAKN